MEEPVGKGTTAAKRTAVVTGANKGIGLEICRQLSSRGVLVVLTARDERRGTVAVEELRSSGLSDVLFHQLDVADPSSVSSLANFVKTQFGKLDILVNNAGAGGLEIDPQDVIALSQVTNIPGEIIRKQMGTVDEQTEERLDELLKSFLKDFNEQKLEENGWPTSASAYKVSKVTVSTYTRILAEKFPKIRINCVHPGFVKTDINFNTGNLTVEEGAKGPVMLALLPDGSPTGLFYDQSNPSTFE
ncbi:salutaridine reductase-like isoform X5 [Asparagus officinalis]|uniref:salutaridine reductase-like isoform X5 n=1 Tax=Asparagus officinalis TaxID=4686 RepID=UPI00098E1529|nr:salutaridine reductase-like isoform X5 [Asparagus officinalis]